MYAGKIQCFVHILVRFFLSKDLLQFFWMWASEKSNMVLGSQNFDFSNPIYIFIYLFIYLFIHLLLTSTCPKLLIFVSVSLEPFILK